MTIKATFPPAPTPEPTEVKCEDCRKMINPGNSALCQKCVGDAIETAEFEAREEAEEENEPSAKQIREWAHRRFIMGQISREVREELELCATDIECGHG